MLANQHTTVYYEDDLPHLLVRDLRKAATEDCILDGELVSLDGDYYVLRKAVAHKDERLAVKVWDVLSIDLKIRMEQRKKWLQDNLRETDLVQLTPYKICTSKKELLQHFDTLVQQGFEGQVIKSNGSYNAPWLKRRTSDTHDAVILAIKKTDEWLREKVPATFLVGCYDPKEQKFKAIGDVSSGLTTNEKQVIGEFGQTIIVKETSEYLYVKPLIVVEINYYEKRKKGLRFPKLLRVRFDKDPKSCLLPNFWGV